MAKPIFFGISAPFINGSNVLPVQADLRLIKNDLIILLMTVPGERVMRPDYGTNLRNQLFDPIDSISIPSLRSNIIGAIARYEPRVRTSRVDIETFPDENRIHVRITAFAVLVDNKEFFVELDLPVGSYEVQVRNV